MEESNISNSEKTIQNINNKIFLHFIKPEFLPVNSVYQSISEIDNITNNSCEEIIINDLLDYVPYSEATNILNIIADKIKSGGHIIVQSTDLYHLASSITFMDIDTETAKMILYNNKKNIFTLNEIKTELSNRNLEIIEKRYINIFEYYIKAQKI